MSRLILVEPSAVADAVRERPAIAGFLAQGVERSHGVMTLETIGDGLRQDFLQLWLCIDDQADGAPLIGIGLTSLVYEPSGLKTCTVYLCAGKGMRGETGHMGQVEAWARDVMMCDRMVIYARKGWARELPDYDLSQYLLTKTFEGNAHVRRQRQSAGADDANGALRPGNGAPGDDPVGGGVPIQHGRPEPVHGPEDRRLH